nr:hypothetical transcript [Hymenolepis microstoma]
MPIRYATVQHPASNYTALFYTLQMPPKRQDLVILRHNCARCTPAISENAAQVVRDEADILSADFNARLFDTIMGTAALTFYCTILPCFFVKPKGLNLDVTWCVSHTIFTAFTFLLIHWNYLLPSAYLDLLHRCASHLGCWQEQSPSSHSGYLNWHAWSLLQTYPKGIHVKHVRGLFESVGGSNAAEPGNSTHFRFYYWFSSPMTVMNALCYIAVTVSLSQLFALEVIFEWSKLINLAAISPFSLMNLYRMLRNRTVLTWIWNGEHPSS